jgi:hypothetical protein
VHARAETAAAIAATAAAAGGSSSGGGGGGGGGGNAPGQAGPTLRVFFDTLAHGPTPAALRSAAVALESLSRTETGQSAIATTENVQALMAAASTLFGVPAAAAGAAAGAGASSAGPSAATQPLPPATLARLNGHLEPLFRLLERLARGASGLALLRASGAAARLAPAVEWAQTGLPDGGATGAAGVRVLARLLGEDLGELISTVARAGEAGGPTLGEGDFAASLLASLALDASVAARFVSAPTLVTSAVALLARGEGAGATPRAAAAVAQALRRLASHGADHAAALVDAGAPAALMRTAAASRAARAWRATTEATAALAELLSAPEELAAADGGAPGGAPGAAVAWAAATLAEAATTDAALAGAALALLHAAQALGAPRSELLRGGVVRAALAAMREKKTAGAASIELQLAGTLVLAALAAPDIVEEEEDGEGGGEGGAGGAGGGALAPLALDEALPLSDPAVVRDIVASDGVGAALANLEAAARGSWRASPEAPADALATAAAAAGGITRFLPASAALLGRPSLALALISTRPALTVSRVFGGGRGGAEEGGEEGGEGGDEFGEGEGAAAARAAAADGDAAAAAADSAGHALRSALVAATLHLLHVLCATPESGATADAKARGLVRSMVGA